MDAGKIRLVHIINSMEYGGAETMLCRLALRTDSRRFETSVVSLIDSLPAAAPLRGAGIPLATMGMKPGVSDPRGLFGLVRHLKRLRPDVIQTWMDHSNLIGGLANRLATRAPMAWGVHHSEHVIGLAKRTTIWTVSACARLSKRIPARIVCCSQKSRELYQALGFDESKLMHIPNGFDLSQYRPDFHARLSVRKELGLEPDAPIVGLAARYDVLKDHATFLQAADILAGRRPDVRFVLCGRGVDRENAELAALAETARLAGRVHFLGHRQDGARLMAAFDLATSSSISEAFPLAVGESMACAVPCVVTDVGDSRLIVGPFGKVVPPRDPAALAEGWLKLLSLSPGERTRLGLAARQRITDHYDLDRIVRQYESLYESLVASGQPRRLATPHDVAIAVEPPRGVLKHEAALALGIG